MTVTRMEIVYRWETGDVVRMYSPKERKCKSKIRKLIGSYLVCFGASILFGKSGWETYINMQHTAEWWNEELKMWMEEQDAAD